MTGIPQTGFFPRALAVSVDGEKFDLQTWDGIEAWIAACASQIGDRGEFIISDEDVQQCSILGGSACC